MHPKNVHTKPYEFPSLVRAHPELSTYTFINDFGNETIDFSSSKAVFHLNKALLKSYYGIQEWVLPKGYLCPPIPGRADYIHHLADLLSEENSKEEINGLDIGVGANCIYPILGVQIYDWHMVGADINPKAVAAARENVLFTEALQKKVEIRHQMDNALMFRGIIRDGEYFHFTMCNPPFHASEEAAVKGTLRKLKNLKASSDYNLNFGGQARELWCNGGEALFIKRMIKQSVMFKDQVGWFTTLVSKKENLQKIYKQLDKLKAMHRTIEMEQGHKKSRIVVWRFE
ncbi:MAG: 23S rRNA (adenine(1618)-N(6))-methyltransferase RlmF [Bacteroidota bacterium]